MSLPGLPLVVAITGSTGAIYGMEQLGYRLKRLHEGGKARIAPALSNNPPAIRRP